MKLHILGISGPFPESNGATSGYLLEAGNTLLQFDLGSGVLARLTALMPPESLSALFLSHWHFDHAADLTVLLYRLEAMDRTLQIYAPVDESSALRKIVSGASCFTLTDIKPGDVITVGSCAVSVSEARHPVPAVGFRVESEGRIFGYTGDTNTLPPWRISTAAVPCSLRTGFSLPKNGRYRNRTSPQRWLRTWQRRPGWIVWY